MNPLNQALVGLIDYQAGNHHSIENAFLSIGARVKRVMIAADMENCSHLVLPGVGAFGFCKKKLESSGLLEGLQHFVFNAYRPLLGICVGMQLLSNSSEESPEQTGLGWCGGEVKQLSASPGICVPHVGWNAVQFNTSFGSFAAGDERDFYFDHSFAYHKPAQGNTIAYCRHGELFSAIIVHQHIVAVQFHPEKSQEMGLQFLKGFLHQCA